MNAFRFLFQSCLYCQSHFCLDDQSICEVCAKAWQRSPIITHDHKQYLSRSLLEWRENAPSVGDFVKRLKGEARGSCSRLLSRMLNRHSASTQKSQYEFMAKRFWSEYYGTERYSRGPLVFIPAPARDQKADDHASLFAMELARLFDSPCEKWLKRTNNEEQKGLAWEERVQTQLELREDIDLDKSRGRRGKIIFVDDLLASGQTARAGYIALDKPKRFEVWTIAYRPLFLATALAKTRSSDITNACYQD